MNYKSIAILVGGSQLLLGCDVLFPDSNSGFSASQAQYPAAIRNGSNTAYSEVVTENGFTGYMGNPDGTLSEVRVRMNEERTIAYVSKDGGAEVEYENIDYRYSNDSTYVYGRWRNADGDIAYIEAANWDSMYLDTYEAGATEYSRGYGGLQTAPEDLPDSADYTGYFYTYGDARTRGNMTLNADFANGDLGGTVTGHSHTFSGTIDGSINDARVSGTATLEGDVTGDLDFAGAAYGSTANQIRGGIAGTVTIEDEDLATGGYFYTSQSIGNIAN